MKSPEKQNRLQDALDAAEKLRPLLQRNELEQRLRELGIDPDYLVEYLRERLIPTLSVTNQDDDV